MAVRSRTRNEFTRLCEQAGLTLDQAADRLALSERQVQRYVAGESKPSQLAMRVLREAAYRSSPPEGPTALRFIDLSAGNGGLPL